MSTYWRNCGNIFMKIESKPNAKSDLTLILSSPKRKAQDARQFSSVAHSARSRIPEIKTNA